MITFFALPKPFFKSGGEENDWEYFRHISIIQRNAIQSWLRLRPACEVILFGRDAGVAETAAELGARYVPDLPTTSYGTPLLDQAFALVQEMAKHRLVCYVNADIIILSEFTAAIQRIRFKRFLMVGRRWNLDLRETLDFDQPDWEADLRARVQREGRLFSVLGCDFFAFPRGTIGALPPFAVGRPGWDNWMIYNARRQGVPVVEATREAMVVHQKHGYSHVPAHVGNLYEGPEADRNLELLGGNRARFQISDSTHILTRWGVFPALGAPYLARRVITLATLHPSLRPLAELVKRVVGRR